MKKYRNVFLIFTCTGLLLMGCTKNQPTESSGKETQESVKEEQTQIPTETEVEDNLDTVSMREFLADAMLPLGSTLYVYGGGWNEEDDGAGVEAVTLGVSQRWLEFFEENDANYNYENTRYQIHDGLDCSGYVGWVAYNTFEQESNQTGYVFKSTEMAQKFADFGWGQYTEATNVSDWKVGDIMSMKGHVWICLGTCEDKTVLVLHSSPPGVRLCGTSKEDGTAGMASRLAYEFTRQNLAKWYERYSDLSDYVVASNYLQKSSQMRWNEKTFKDALEFQNMTPEEFLEYCIKPST